MVEVYADRVSITNPGGLANGLSKESLGSISVRRNELIADYFSRTNKGERVGSGIKRMIEAMQKENLHVPNIAISDLNSFFTISFQRPIRTTQKTREKIIELIKNNSGITARELAEETGLTLKGIEWHLKKLKFEKSIQRIGPDKGGQWKMIK